MSLEKVVPKITPYSSMADNQILILQVSTECGSLFVVEARRKYQHFRNLAYEAKTAVVPHTQLHTEVAESS
jgi:hypothetical protein